MAWVLLVLLLTMLSGLWRSMRGPTAADRLLGIQLLGTTGIAFLLVLAQWQQEAVWRDVALVLALLASVVTAAMVQLLRRPAKKMEGERD